MAGAMMCTKWRENRHTPLDDIHQSTESPYSTTDAKTLYDVYRNRIMQNHYCLTLLLLLSSFLLLIEGRHTPEIVNYDDDIRDSEGGEDGEIVEGEPGFRWLGLGVLSNMQQFFDNLKDNLDALESIPSDDKESLLTNPPELSTTSELRRNNGGRSRMFPRAATWVGHERSCDCTEDGRTYNSLPSRRSAMNNNQKPGTFEENYKCFHKNLEKDDTTNASRQERERKYRPSATAAYLHALRTHHPSYKIRNFVESSEPVSYRGTNRYDPSLMWTGLGRKR